MASESNPTPTKIWRWGVGIKIAISVILLGVLGYQASNSELTTHLLRLPKRWEWAALGFAVICLGYTLSFVRWWCLLVGARFSTKFVDAFRWSLMSQPFHLISFGVAGGDLLRIYLLCRSHPQRKAVGAATVLMDRGIGLLMMFAAVAVAGWLVDWSSLTTADPSRTAALVQVWRLSVVLVLVAGTGGVGLLILGNRTWLATLIVAIPHRKWQNRGANFAQLLTLYRQQPSVLAAALLLSGANVACLSAGVYCVANSLTSEPPGFLDHFLITPISLIAGAAPLPGGLGSQELVMSWMYAAFSHKTPSMDVGILVASGYRALTLALAGIGWLVYSMSGRSGRVAYQPGHVEDRFEL